MAQIQGYLHSALEALGAFSVLCGALSRLPLGKAARVLGRLGNDVAGAVRELRD